MIRTFVIAQAALTFAAAASVALSQVKGPEASSNGPAEQALKDLIRQWDEAFAQRDTVAIDRILADDFTLTDASGAVLNKAQYTMSIVKSPDISRIPGEEKPSATSSEEVIVRVYGDSAVVTGRSSVKGRSRGKAQFLGGPYRFTDVWVKRQGRWQVVATQGTNINQ